MGGAHNYAHYRMAKNQQERCDSLEKDVLCLCVVVKHVSFSGF
jgi:hypothetical protein